jgi:protein-disulfide isomerase
MLLGLALAGCGARAESRLDQDTDTRYLVPIDGSPVRGPAAAWVTIVEFADFQCSYCVIEQPVLDDIAKKYGDKVRFVFKQFPIARHTWAEPAAELSIEARAEQGEAGFWRAYDALWPMQSALGGPALEKLGADLGLDPALVRASLYTHRHAAEIGRDVDLGKRLVVDATPYFFIDGRRLVGAQPVADFSVFIDEEIALVGKLIADGTDPAAVYDEIMAAAVPAT